LSERPTILIAGAGIGGLTAGLSLLHKGFDVVICDQAPHLHEVGAGVQIAANASRVLFALGLGAELDRIGFQPSERATRLWNTGKSWTQIALGASAIRRYGFPHYTLHRADLQQMLIEAVRREKPDAIRLAARCVDFEQSDTGIVLTLDGGEVIAGDALVGADGIHSTIRRVLFGPDLPAFTGFVAWRGLAPAAKLPEGLRRQISTNWIGPNAHAVHYLLRNGELMNIIAVVERDDWQIESWTARGTTAEWAADYDGWHSDIHAIIANVEVPFKWALMVHEPLERWSDRRVTLLGDACHAALPFLAQGAATAIEDGYVLARCAERHRGDLAAAWRHYERARIERTTRIVRGAAEQTARLHNPALADPATAEEHVKGVYDEQLVTQRLGWLYSYDAVNGPID